MVQTSDRSVSIGRIFSRAFGVMGSNPGVVFGVALVLGAGPQILYFLLLGSKLGQGQGAPLSLAAVGASLLAGVISLVARSLVSGCLTRATVAYSQGRRATLGECLTVGLERVLPVIAVSILFAIVVVLGIMLFIVPGIMLAIMWSAVIPIIVEERTGVFGAFNRSQDLTRGARWKIFGLFLLLVVIGIGIGMAVVLISTLTLGISYLNPSVSLTAGAIVMQAIAGMFGAALWSTLQTSLFVELREWKEGPIDAKLGEIFE